MKFRVWDFIEKCFFNEERKTICIEPDGELFMLDHDEGYGRQFPMIKTMSPELYIIQYSSGLKDKNGKEIYEGDILNSDKGNTIVVNFDSGVFYVIVHGDAKLPLYRCFPEKCNVAGNIFENPELLEVKG